MSALPRKRTLCSFDLKGGLLRPERARAPEQIVAQHIIESTLPGLVRVAADVDALGEFHLLCSSVLHIDIDVQNEGLTFCTVPQSAQSAPASRAKSRSQPLQLLISAEAAILSRSSVGMETILKRPEASSFC
jgi:hypothetical protein